MKIRISALVCAFICIFCLLSGCKVELPAQHNSSSAAISSMEESSTISSASSSSEPIVSTPASAAGSSSSGLSSSAAEPNSSASRVKSSSPVSAPTKAPVSKAPAEAQVKEQACSVTITAADILKNKDRFNESQLSVVPKDGILYSNSKLQITDGETVFAVLTRAAKASSISVMHSTSAFQTEYVQSIGGIQEKQYGTASGWTYLVNGKQPPVACNNYKLKSGDRVEWVFYCGNP